MTEFDPDEDFDPAEEDGALADEDFEQPKRTINQSGTKGGPIDIAPEDSIAPSDREGGEESNRTPFPINLEITISKPGDQSIEITGSARDGTIEIDRIQYNPTSSIAADITTTAYAGPPFNNLDADLIMMFEQYIEERGINEELATILPVLIEQKEQKEYVNWLQSKCEGIVSSISRLLTLSQMCKSSLRHRHVRVSTTCNNSGPRFIRFTLGRCVHYQRRRY